MKINQIINLLILLSLSACFGGGITPFGGSHNGNPDAKTNEEKATEQHCEWVDKCAGDITFDGCLSTQGPALETAMREIKAENLIVNFGRYEDLSCTVVSGSFVQFTLKQNIIKLWRNESFLQPTQ